MKSGKRFENNFKKSVPSNIFFYRFKDGTASWDKGSLTRFQQKNICDCMLFDGSRLYLFELKSIKGKSIPFSNIRENQLKELSKAQKFKNIIAGIVIEFNELDRAFFMCISDITDFMRIGSRKSIPIEYCVEKGIEIEITKKRVNDSFNVRKLLNEIGD